MVALSAYSAVFENIWKLFTGSTLIYRQNKATCLSLPYYSSRYNQLRINEALY
jgi:hypothetical protein